MQATAEYRSLEERLPPCMVEIDVEGVEPLKYVPGERLDFLSQLKQRLDAFASRIAGAKGYEDRRAVYEQMIHHLSPLNSIYCRLVDCANSYFPANSDVKKDIRMLVSEYDRHYEPFVASVQEKYLKKPAIKKLESIAAAGIKNSMLYKPLRFAYARMHANDSGAPAQGNLQYTYP